MKIWLVEERCYRYEPGLPEVYKKLFSTDVVYLASTKELAIKFVHDHHDDTKNVWVELDVDVAIYDMKVDSLFSLHSVLKEEGVNWYYDCRTIPEWCEEYDQDLTDHHDKNSSHRIEIGGES